MKRRLPTASPWRMTARALTSSATDSAWAKRRRETRTFDGDPVVPGSPKPRVASRRHASAEERAVRTSCMKARSRRVRAISARRRTCSSGSLSLEMMRKRRRTGLPSPESHETPALLRPTTICSSESPASFACGTAMPGPIHELTMSSRACTAATTAAVSGACSSRASAPASSRMAPSFERLRSDTIRVGER